MNTYLFTNIIKQFRDRKFRIICGKSIFTFLTDSQRSVNTQHMVAPLICIWRASSKGMPRHAYRRWALILHLKGMGIFLRTGFIRVIGGKKNNFSEITNLLTSNHIQFVSRTCSCFSHECRSVVYRCIIEKSQIRLLVFKNAKIVISEWEQISQTGKPDLLFAKCLKVTSLR